MRVIFDGSFPPEERLLFAEIAASLDRGERLCFLAREAGEAVGFAIVLPLPDVPGVALLDYLAVAEARRGQGIGSALLEALRARLDRPGAVGIILEVEPPHTAQDAAERRRRERRIAFYQRHGIHLLELARPYMMDAYTETGLLEMRLMWWPLGPAGGLPSAELVARCIRSLFVTVYGRSPDDPALREMLGEARM